MSTNWYKMKLYKKIGTKWKKSERLLHTHTHTHTHTHRHTHTHTPTPIYIYIYGKVINKALQRLLLNVQAFDSVSFNFYVFNGFQVFIVWNLI